MKKIIIYVFLFFIIITSFTIINCLNTYFSKRTKLFIESKGIVYTQQFLQEAILENVVEEINISSLYYMKEDTNQNVDSILINTAQINKILGLVNKSLEHNINNISEEKIELPLSSILGDTMFSNIGPMIKLKVYPIGSYKCDVISEVAEYGINNSLFKIYIKVNLKIQSIIPLIKSESDVECQIPIVLQIIQGEVPRYYYNTDSLVPDVYDDN